MKTKVVYFIAHYGTDHCHWWDADNRRWIPQGMKLYRTTYDSIEEMNDDYRIMKNLSSGWMSAGEVFIDSELKYIA